MPFFKDKPVATLEDLTAYESSLPTDVDPEAALDKAHRALSASIQKAMKRPGDNYPRSSSELVKLDGDFGLEHVVVTPPLKLWHTFKALAIIYADAAIRDMAYAPKTQEYAELANWSRDLLFQTGIGLSTKTDDSVELFRTLRPATDLLDRLHRPQEKR